MIIFFVIYCFLDLRTADVPDISNMVLLLFFFTSLLLNLHTFDVTEFDSTVLKIGMEY